MWVWTCDRCLEPVRLELWGCSEIGGNVACCMRHGLHGEEHSEQDKPGPAKESMQWKGNGGAGRGGAGRGGAGRGGASSQAHQSTPSKLKGSDWHSTLARGSSGPKPGRQTHCSSARMGKRET